MTSAQKNPPLTPPLQGGELSYLKPLFVSVMQLSQEESASPYYPQGGLGGRIHYQVIADNHYKFTKHLRVIQGYLRCAAGKEKENRFNIIHVNNVG